MGDSIVLSAKGMIFLGSRKLNWLWSGPFRLSAGLLLLHTFKIYQPCMLVFTLYFIFLGFRPTKAQEVIGLIPVLDQDL